VGSETWHEALDKLTPATQDLHRALQSVMEEFEAVDWYQQRFDSTPDPELKAILAHNRDEEKEHAAMLLEWLRRHDPGIHSAFETYLFKEGELTDLEEQGKGAAASATSSSPALPERTFTVGSLKGER